MDINYKATAAAIGNIIGTIIGAFLAAAIALWLWREIAVEIFIMPNLNYWQMYGLIWLCRLIFGSRFAKISTES